MLRRTSQALLLSFWGLLGCEGTSEIVTPPTVPSAAPAQEVAPPSVPAAPAPTKAQARRSHPADAACTLTTTGTGDSLRLKDYKGKVVVVDFWGTFCEPCKKSFPKLQDLYARHRSDGLVILGVSEDDEKDGIREFVKLYGAKFDTCWDTDHKTAVAFNPSTMPSSYVVDKKGAVRFVHQGYHDGEEADIEAQVKELLAE
jgi:peroxiredoxin